MSVRFLLACSLRSLHRGGQRSLLAVVCIAFGVLALVAMQLLANVVGQATNVEPRLKLGGDLLISGSETGVDGGHRELLDTLLRDGVLSGVTLFAAGEGGMIRSVRSGSVQFVGRALGVDARTYPLVGEVVLAGGGTLADALAMPSAVVLTRDLARGLGVSAGDTVRYGGRASDPARLVVSGVARSIPDRRGQTMMYSLETARLLAGGAPVRYYAAATAVDDSAAAARIAGSQGTSERIASPAVRRAVDEAEGSMSRVFGRMLRGAGLLGLIIGGIGIAYTLQVMLTRRRMEIATLRAIGYRSHHLVLLFGIEAGALGAIGGIAGSMLAIALAAQLVSLLDRTAGALMLEYALSPGIVAAGPLVGVATAVLFGTAAIVRASAVRPGVLLRDLPVRPPRGAALRAIALNALLALVFTIMAGIVMDSFLAGAVVVIVAAAGIALLGVVLVALLWVVVRLPLPRLPLINMARANLRSRQVRSAFSLIALFVGVFAIGFAAAAMTTGRDRVAAKRGSDAGLNIRVYAGADESAAVPAALREIGAETIVPGRGIEVRVIDSTGARVPVPGDLAFHAKDDLDLLVTIDAGAATWTGDKMAVLMPDHLRRPPFSRSTGERLTLVSGPDSVRVTVAGFYSPVDEERFSAPAGLIGAAAVARALGVSGGPTNYLAAVPEEAVAGAAAALGERLPASLVVSRRELNDFLVATYESLFTFVVAIAGLALLAGAVLIANAVSLAMVERRRELGILMAVGYTSRRVLRTIVLENGALGLVAGAAGIVAVRVVIAILNAREAALRLEFGVPAALILLASSILLATVAAGVVAWGPVHVRPLEVLRDE